MIDPTLLAEQTLNGLQLGVMLFLMSAGLTLVFGIMNFINLAHGSIYMLGAFFAASLVAATGSFMVGLIGGTAAAAAVGFALDRVALRRFYARDHLDQVLATFALILFFNELVRVIWGAKPYYMDTPSWLAGGIELLPGMIYPAYRLAIAAAGLALGGVLYGLIAHTRIGMRIRAGASNREMVAGLGVDIERLSSLVYVGAAGLAGLAGILTGPILAIEVGMGEQILILTFVVIVIGGLGSIRGAFVASIVVGLADAYGRFLLPQLLGFTLGPALSSMVIYILMAAVLVWRPQGLLAAKSG